MTTVSAPGGISAPVKIRAAVPGSRRVGDAPAVTRWLRRNAASSLSQSPWRKA
jgi:hypothetical protein